ncbi:hypothetical protein GA0061098_102955 [Bradyrhizobium shewense]|uniref:Cysteine rich repeat-containing protein n=1 Tax=Bradyrhizobium shewense TaxID=1761772 RepID=A0A1C3XR04_9BRAD|nr:hypothetical protein [Bradyrhizobium shewense]SCB54702.1 hypothetical protein GA0061098_102955 [Bradyrhizobium shewense]
MPKLKRVLFILSIVLAPVAAAASDRADPLADQACFDAVSHIARDYDESGMKPTSPLVAALIRRCNGHPNRLACDAVSNAVVPELGSSPFTCGSNTADSVPLILPPADSSSPDAGKQKN